MTKLTTLETIAHAKANEDRERYFHNSPITRALTAREHAIYVRAFQDGVRWATTAADEQERQLDAAFKALMVAKPDKEA